MRTAFRYIYVGLSWLMLLAIVVQVFFAGLMLFGTGGGGELHNTTGWIIHTAVYPFLLVPWLAGAERRGIVLGLAFLVAVFVQPFLVEARESVPILAALHPVNALLIFVLALALARDSLQLFRTTPRRPSTRPPEPVISAR